VVGVRGGSAVRALVWAAGLPVDRFAFEGFLPARAAARAARLRALAGETRALVFLEAGRRLPAFLDDALAALGDRDAVIARELTKLHEEMLRGRLSELRAAVAGGVRGEVTLLVGGGAGGGGGGAGADAGRRDPAGARCRPRCTRAQRGRRAAARLLASRGLPPGPRAARRLTALTRRRRRRDP